MSDLGTIRDLAEGLSQSQTPTITIKGFASVGEVRGRGSVSIEAREFITDLSGQSFLLIAGVTGLGDHGRSENVAISFAEITTILSAIERLKKVNSSVSVFEKFEVEYKSENGLRLVVFNNDSGAINLAVGINSSSAFFSGTSGLEEIRLLFIKALEVIESKMRSQTINV